ncbi:polysaccharide deacetylase family protein [Tumebacillus sp. BK434]|uniref:polysaccharide deacetylase family protein n=1 Tax=Tumebacillus sp. BK434 TaxID=2512169 RepID=UPI001404EB9A|nr:polysaccharide deacetylase family protein [Tumebacillus sp. BK434]
MHSGKLVAACAVCLLMFSGITDTLAINTYVRDLKGLAIPVQTYRVEHPVVALTFDVSQDSDPVAQILVKLRTERARATFFLTGEWVERHPHLARAIVKEGHEVGRSLYSSRTASELSPEQLRQELQKTDDAWRAAHLPEVDLFRVPDGETNGQVAKEIRKRHENLIAWSVTAVPESPGAAAGVWSGLPSALSAGDIVRLRADRLTLEGISTVLTGIRGAGYDVKTISSMQEEVE